MSKLPTLSAMTSSPSFRPYSSCQYTRSKTKGDKTNIVPHPPVRQRPVSAHPQGSLQTLKNPTIAGNWTNGFLNCDNAGAKALDSVIDLDIRLHETEDKVNNLVNAENESFKKDCVIDSLREEIEFLRRRGCNDSNPSTNFSTGCHQKIAALHNQIQLKNEENTHLLATNETLRGENENLRSGVDTGMVCTENQNLRVENERLSEAYHETNLQVSQLTIMMSQRDHTLAVLENEVKKANKEKSQATMMVTNLQKEVTVKDEQLKKTRANVEKQKSDLESKRNEISTMTARLAKNLDYKKTLKDLRSKEEEVNNLKYVLKSAEDKILTKDEQLVKLHEETNKANKHMADSENMYKCQIQSYQDKLREKDATIKNLNIQLSANKLALEELKERSRENSSIEIEATESVSGILCEIEKRLIKNGRSCKSLDNEIETLRAFQVSDNLRWVKECFISSLCLELNWEREIEDALKSVTGDSERANTPPTLLIQILQEKLDNNLKEIDSLENQINTTDIQHTKDMENISNKMKDKYKQKAEKAIREIKEEERKKLDEEIREIKEEEKKKLDEEIQKLRDEENDRLDQALKAQRVNDVEKLQKANEEVIALQNERKSLNIEIELLQKNIGQCKLNEIEYKEKVNKEMSSKNEFFEKMKRMEEECQHLKENDESRRSEMNELKVVYKDKINEQAETITTLEYQVVSLKHSKTTMEGKIETLNELAKDYKEKEDILSEEKELVNKLNKEIAELSSLNETLKSSLEVAQKDCENEKETCKAINEKLHSALANLSDLKGDLSDKEKQKIENLEEKSSKQEKELVEQQIHLVKLSTLVDEQKIKLIEQDQQIEEQHAMLADRHIPWARKSCKLNVETTPEERQIGRCVGKRYEKIIKDQRNIIQDMKQTLDHPAKHLEISNVIYDLKDELAAQEHHSAVTDQKLYREICRLEEQLSSLIGELSSEQIAHQNNLNALEQCEEVYLRFVHEINKELDIGEILGAKPLSFSLEEERERILTDRSKGLEVILNRIKSVKSRIERKDQLLESYDDDVKKYRETKNYADQKSYEVETLQTDLSESRNEVSYLQEALKKWRGECDTLKREIVSLKQKKVLLVDYKCDVTTSPKLSKQKKGRQKQSIFDYAPTGEQTA